VAQPIPFQADRPGALAAELAEATASAKAAGLHYVSDDRPGIRRRKFGKGFVYFGPDGERVRDDDTLARIRRLAIPPAYRDVWICPDPRGHVQATGRDARGRKQYRYHARWREVRDAVKYDRMIAFTAVLPAIRARCHRDLSLPGMPRDKVLATVLCLLERSRIRVGNEEYAKENGSYGLTTLRNQHAKVEGSAVVFSFRGKSGKVHRVRVHDRRLARVVARCLEIPGQELFQYVGENGECHAIDSGEVNDYLRQVAGADFTAKDFRTWAGTVLAASELRRCERCRNQRHGKRQVVAAIEKVAAQLGNTPSVCRKSYVHPAVLAAYLDGTIDRIEGGEKRANDPHALDADERFALALLETAAAAAKAQPTLIEGLSSSLRRLGKRGPANALKRAAA
jgi:DNA topoisomerase-1